MSDTAAICEIINFHAERGRMLHRSLEDLYASLREFRVAEADGQVVGCVAVDIFWADLAEVKSLAVASGWQKKGVGSALLSAAVEDARTVGVKRLFVLTYEKDFFAARGFSLIDRGTLPEKVWRECIACPKCDACDEIAMVRNL